MRQNRTKKETAGQTESKPRTCRTMKKYDGFQNMFPCSSEALYTEKDFAKKNHISSGRTTSPPSPAGQKEKGSVTKRTASELHRNSPRCRPSAPAMHEGTDQAHFSFILQKPPRLRKKRLSSGSPKTGPHFIVTSEQVTAVMGKKGGEPPPHLVIPLPKNGQSISEVSFQIARIH